MNTPAPNENIGYILIVDRRSSRNLYKFLEAIEATDAPSSRHIRIVFPPELADRVGAQVYSVAFSNGLPSFHMCDDPKQRAAELIATSTEPYLALSDLRKERSPQSLLRGIQKSRSLFEPLSAHLPSPLLLPSRGTPWAEISKYLARALNFSNDPTSRNALGVLPLLHSKLFLEYIDVNNGDLDFNIWMETALPVSYNHLPWRYKVVLRKADGSEIHSDTDELQERIDIAGNRFLENIRVTVPTAKLSSGTYQLFLRFVDQAEGQIFEIKLRSRVGALQGARTIHVPPKSGYHSGFRYLLNTTGHNQQSFITVQTGSTKRDNWRWKFLLLKKDANFILRSSASRRMRALRLIRIITLPFFARRDVWIIGERPDTAQDNGIHLFKYLRKSRPDIRAYYILADTSPQFPEVTPLGRVIRHSSLRHKLLMLHANVTASAYATHHLVPYGWRYSDFIRHLAWRIGSRRVYLKHGIHTAPNGVKRGASGFEMVVSATERETEALRAGSGYGQRIKEVGLPRYDSLKATPPSRTILFAPTWRRYLPSRLFAEKAGNLQPFQGSDYDIFINKLLKGPELHRLLEEYDYTLEFLPHYNVEEFYHNYVTAGSRISVLSGNDFSFQEKLVRCDLFLTDHSSVHFDAAFMNTPVIYARFDREEFERLHAPPTWFDYEVDGFGPVTYNLDDTLNEIRSFLRHECAPREEYLERIRHAFRFRDANSCERVTLEIERLLEDRD